MKKIYVVSAIFLSLALAGCTGGNSQQVTPIPETTSPVETQSAPWQDVTPIPSPNEPDKTEDVQVMDELNDGQISELENFCLLIQGIDEDRMSAVESFVFYNFTQSKDYQRFMIDGTEYIAVDAPTVEKAVKEAFGNDVDVPEKGLCYSYDEEKSVYNILVAEDAFDGVRFEFASQEGNEVRFIGYEGIDDEFEGMFARVSIELEPCDNENGYVIKNCVFTRITD